MSRDTSFYSAVYALHVRLLGGDPTLLGEIAALIYEPLLRQLRSEFPEHTNPLADDQLLAEKAADAILDYGKAPAVAKATTGAGVLGFLAMRAKSRVQNGLRAERTRQRLEGRFAHGFGPGKDNNARKPVELPPPEGEYLGVSKGPSNRPQSPSAKDVERDEEHRDEELAGRRQEILDSVQNDRDRQVLTLMLDGVRETARYAALLEIEHLSLDQQRRVVKQNKDRLRVSVTRVQARKQKPPKRRGRPPRHPGDRRG